MKSFARAELKEADCFNSHLVNWYPGNENIFGIFEVATKSSTSPGLISENIEY